MDFNVDPMSSVIAQVIGGTVYVLDEIVIRQATTTQACEEFQKRYTRHDPGVYVFGDASGHHLQTTGASDLEMVREHFAVHSSVPVYYRFPKSNPPVRERVNQLNRQLRSAAGRIGLFIEDRKSTRLNSSHVAISY